MSQTPGTPTTVNAKSLLPEQWRYLPRLLRLLWESNPTGVLVVGFLLMLSGLLPVALLEAMRRFADVGILAIGGTVPLRTALLWLGVMAAIGVVNNFISAGHQWLSLLINERFKQQLEARLMDKAGCLPLASFEAPQLHDQLQRARVGIDQHLTWVASALPIIPLSLVTAVGVLAYMGGASPVFPVVLVLGILPLMIIDSRYGRKRWSMERGQTEAQRTQQYLEDLMTQRHSGAEIRFFGLRDFLLGGWNARFETLSRERVGLSRKAFLSGIMGQVYLPLTMFMVTATVVVWLVRGELTVGYFAAFVATVERFSMTMWRLFSAAARVNSELLYVQDMFDYLDIAEERDISGLHQPETGSSGETNVSGLPQVVFKNVHFGYPNTATEVLRGINLTLHAQECVALVGENGAGKSTLAKLLLGLYQPTGGEIMVDGVWLGTIPPQVWRERTAAVLQNFMRYELTARENIGFGDLARLDDMSAIEAAAAKSGADAVIKSLPAQYETVLGKAFDDAGQDLSTGQWQKLALARAYFAEAEVLVLDEPTAALDVKAEAEVYRQFQQMARGKSVLLISHRLGSARFADRIVVLKGGQIVETGSHKELLSLGGEYAKMYEAQASWYQD